MQYSNLQNKAKSIRHQILNEIFLANSGHPGSSLSTVDILTVLFFEIMSLNKENPLDKDFDKFVLSKGHAAPAFYVILSELGFIPKEELTTLRKVSSNLQGHPHYNPSRHIFASTGSLGQGLSIANGMALAHKLDSSNATIYTLLGDGECQEGQIWEAAMTAAHYKLDNLVAILDNNGLQIDGRVVDIMSPYPFKEKWQAFGWHVIEIDGHNYQQILNAFIEAKNIKTRPVIIIAKTVKGKGVSFMEDKVEWHGKAPNKEQLDKALLELSNETVI